MFQQAVARAHRWTFPIIVVVKQPKKEPIASVGAGILLNADGWVLTAAHILQEGPKLADAYSKGTVEAFHFIWGNTNDAQPKEFTIDEKSDLGICQLQKFAPWADYIPPQIRSGDVQQGELLCRIGYPLLPANHIVFDWRRTDNKFVFKNLFPIPAFVNEGVVSRLLTLKQPDLELRFMEMSSPGLKGQSGGPLVDSKGLLCGLQSLTSHYPLGFSPQIAGRTEHQFLNVGRAVHIETIRSFLDSHGVRYDSPSRSWSKIVGRFKSMIAKKDSSV